MRVAKVLLIEGENMPPESMIFHLKRAEQRVLFTKYVMQRIKQQRIGYNIKGRCQLIHVPNECEPILRRFLSMVRNEEVQIIYSAQNGIAHTIYKLACEFGATKYKYIAATNTFRENTNEEIHIESIKAGREVAAHLQILQFTDSEIEAGITLSEMRIRFKNLARTNHPDRGGNNDEMLKIIHAHTTLSEYFEAMK